MKKEDFQIISPYFICIGKGLTSFSKLKIKSGIIQKENFSLISVDLSNNPLSDLNGLQKHFRLQTLILNNTLISNLQGISPMPLLESITICGTPLNKSKYLNLMILISFGTQVQSINGIQISPALKKKASDFSPLIFPYLKQGYLLYSENPLQLLTPNKKKLIQFDLSPQEYKEKRCKIVQNDKIIHDLKMKLKSLNSNIQKKSEEEWETESEAVLSQDPFCQNTEEEQFFCENFSEECFIENPKSF